MNHTMTSASGLDVLDLGLESGPSVDELLLSTKLASPTRSLSLKIGIGTTSAGSRDDGSVVVLTSFST